MYTDLYCCLEEKNTTHHVKKKLIVYVSIDIFAVKTPVNWA